jgi:hypothetical protein
VVNSAFHRSGACPDIQKKTASRHLCHGVAGMDIKGVAAAIKEDKTSSLPHQVISKLRLNYACVVCGAIDEVEDEGRGRRNPSEYIM